MEPVSSDLIDHLFEITKAKLWDDIVATHKRLLGGAEQLWGEYARVTKKCGYVYLIGREGKESVDDVFAPFFDIFGGLGSVLGGVFIKIGKTKNPQERLKRLQTGSAEVLTFLTVTLTENMSSLENELKKKYRMHRASGGTEWFEFSAQEAPRDTNPQWYRYFLGHQVNPDWATDEDSKFAVEDYFSDLKRQEGRLQRYNQLDLLKKEMIEALDKRGDAYSDTIPF